MLSAGIFLIKKSLGRKSLKKFKRRTVILLCCEPDYCNYSQAFLPLLLTGEDIGGIHNGLQNCLDVFSWVILWRPINELIFAWNPHLKDISLLNKLATAEVIIIENDRNSDLKNQQKPISEEKETNISSDIKSNILNVN